jgi:hypothetical protein
MYKWYRPASGGNGPSYVILPCHAPSLKLDPAAIGRCLLGNDERKTACRMISKTVF